MLFAIFRWIYAQFEPVMIDVHMEFDSELLSDIALPKRDHLLEFPGRVDVEKREWGLVGVEGLQGELRHDGGVFSDRVKHDRVFELSSNLSNDMDTFRFELFQVR